MEKPSNSELRARLRKSIAQIGALYNKPRPLERIPRTLHAILGIWKQFPDLRLGQMLICAIGRDDLFNVEDDKLIEYLKEWADGVNG